MMKLEAPSVDDITDFLLQEEACLEQEHTLLASVQLSPIVVLTVNCSTPRLTNSFNSFQSFRNSILIHEAIAHFANCVTKLDMKLFIADKGKIKLTFPLESQIP